MTFVELIGQLTLDHVNDQRSTLMRGGDIDLPTLGRHHLTGVRQWVIDHPAKPDEPDHVTRLRDACERFIQSAGPAHLN